MIEITGYKIKEKIGQGGMAAVYLAKHKMLDRDVALKVLQVGAFSDAGFRKSFIKEGRIIAKLEHPHIVKIYDIGIENDQFYMAMELIKNGTLKDRLKQNKKLDLEAILKVISQVASALGYAHGKGYIHRDIKPANILYREDGTAVLTDFGIAKIQGTDSEMTQMGVMAGTPHYMAPEQAIGDTLDQRTDVYSLGVVLYELLTGKKPFEAANTVAVTYEHAHADIPRLTGDYAYLQPVIDKALAKRKEDRYDSVLALSENLLSLVSSEDATIIIPSVSPIYVEGKTKIPWVWITSSAVILSVLIGAYLYKLKADQEEMEKSNQFNLSVSKAEQSYNEGKLYNFNNWTDKICVDWYNRFQRPGPKYEADESSEFHYEQAAALSPQDEQVKKKLRHIRDQSSSVLKLCSKEAADTLKQLNQQEEQVNKSLEENSAPGVIEF